MAKNRTMIEVSLFYIIFMTVFTLRLYLKNVGISALPEGDDSIVSIVFGQLEGLATWTLPVFLLLKNPLEYLKMNKNIAKGILVGMIIGICLCLLRIGALYYARGFVEFDFTLNRHLWWNVIIFVGLTEEVVFRGFILQKIEGISNFWIANIMTTILFTCMHVPYWILIHHYTVIDVLQHSLSVIWLSLFYGLIFKKTQSLWAPIIVHSVNNFMSYGIR
jgi:membrane protease YdiL (CAAX protease family)